MLTPRLLFGLMVILNCLKIRPILLRPYVSECLCAYQEEPIFAENWIEQIKFVDQPCFKCFIRCVAIKVGYAFSDGTANIPVIFQKIPYITMDIINNCNSITKNELDLCEKAYKYSKCIINAFD
ncbi:hypothetical protein RN001_004661 [Aquatica leii]|uniref:Uncharacterized protein n=1 Tax=Aquatica leii TaxID=1421715 RepID=A0AAN7SHK0_9COLE|nr:hypothetical protein RN001_004661 [Aquatica leii]